MKQPILIILTIKFILFYCTIHLSGQDYQTGLGLRVSPYYGVTLKHFIQPERALEGILVTRRGGFSLTGLYEIHTQAFKVPRLNAYGGIGGHINIFQSDNRQYWNWGDDDGDGIRLSDRSRMAIGIDLIIGMEYTLEDLPFNFGIDWKPGLNIIGDQGGNLDQLALSLRFIF